MTVSILCFANMCEPYFFLFLCSRPRDICKIGLHLFASDNFKRLDVPSLSLWFDMKNFNSGLHLLAQASIWSLEIEDGAKKLGKMQLILLLALEFF